MGCAERWLQSVPYASAHFLTAPALLPVGRSRWRRRPPCLMMEGEVTQIALKRSTRAAIGLSMALPLAISVFLLVWTSSVQVRIGSVVFAMLLFLVAATVDFRIEIGPVAVRSRRWFGWYEVPWSQIRSVHLLGTTRVLFRSRVLRSISFDSGSCAGDFNAAVRDVLAFAAKQTVPVKVSRRLGFQWDRGRTDRVRELTEWEEQIGLRPALPVATGQLARTGVDESKNP